MRHSRDLRLSRYTCGSAAQFQVLGVSLSCCLATKLVALPLFAAQPRNLRLNVERATFTVQLLESSARSFGSIHVGATVHIQTRTFSCARRCSTFDVTNTDEKLCPILSSRLGPHQGSIERANIERHGRVWFHIKRPSRTDRRSQQCLTVRTQHQRWSAVMCSTTTASWAIAPQPGRRLISYSARLAVT